MLEIAQGKSHFKSLYSRFSLMNLQRTYKECYRATLLLKEKYNTNKLISLYKLMKLSFEKLNRVYYIILFDKWNQLLLFNF